MMLTTHLKKLKLLCPALYATEWLIAISIEIHELQTLKTWEVVAMTPKVNCAS